MTFHDTRTVDHDASHYHQDLLVWRLAELQLTPRKLARITELSHPLIGDALSGECKKMATLRVIANALGLKWEFLFMLDLPKSEFRRAVEETGR